MEKKKIEEKNRNNSHSPCYNDNRPSNLSSELVSQCCPEITQY